MPDQLARKIIRHGADDESPLSLNGTHPLSVLLRGLIKANLIHHLAHTGGRATLMRIGKAWKPGFDWLPPGGQAFDERLTPLFVFLCATPTPELSPGRFHVLEKAAAADSSSLWTWVILGLNYLRLWDGDAYFKRALECLERAVALRPDWSWSYLLRGEAKRSLLDYNGALADYDEALRRELEFAWAHAFKARVLFQRRTDARDAGLMDKAIKFSPREGWMRAWRGESNRRLGRLAAAERDFKTGLALDPLYDQAYGWRAKLLEARGRHAEAAASLRHGIALCPAFEKAYRQLARVQKAAGDVGAALKTLDKAAALNHRNNWLGNWRVEGHPDDAAGRAALEQLSNQTGPRARAWRAETLVQLGRLDEALAALDGGDPWTLAWRGECLIRLGKPAEALPVLDAAVRGDPVYGRAWAWRGRAHALLGRWETAVDDFDRALAARRVEYSWIFGWRGEAKLELGRLPEALADLDAAVMLDGGCASFYLWRAKARRASGDERGGLDDLLRASDGRFPWRAVVDAEELRREGRAKEALAAVAARAQPRWLHLLRYRIRREGNLPGAARDLDAAFRGTGNPAWLFGLGEIPADAPEGAALLQDASFQSQPGCAGVLAYFGQAKLKRGDRSGLDDLERAAALEPQGWILAWLGEARRQAGNIDGALAALTEALRLDPRYDNAYAWRATALLGKGETGAAISDLRRAIALRPTARAWRDLARAQARLGDWDAALESQREAVRLNPELGWDDDLSRAPRGPWFSAWRGEALLRKGAAREALAALDDALARDRKLAWAYAWRAEARLAVADEAGALEDLARAKRLDAKYARAWETDALLLLKRGEPAKALVSARRAAKLAPYSARLRLSVAKAAAAAGSKAKALSAIEKSLALCPRYPEAEALRRGLAGTDGRELKSLEFFVNYGCNAKCPFCFNPPDASPELERGLPFAELARRMHAGYAAGYRGIKFIGGEVTIREDLPKILGLARRIGYRRIQVTTNGIRLADPRYASRLIGLGAGHFRLSVHGHTPQLHDRLVGVSGALEKIERAVENLRAEGAALGINHVLNRVNAAALPETLLYFKNVLKIDDVIVYFLRYQGFGALAENKLLLKLSMSEAADRVRAAFAALRADGARSFPALIHFTPCAIPQLSEHMLDWRRDDADPDLVTLPDGSEARIAAVTNSGKRQVAACRRCDLRRSCLGVEENYVAMFGEGEFHPIGAPAEAVR